MRCDQRIIEDSNKKEPYSISRYLEKRQSDDRSLFAIIRLRRPKHHSDTGRTFSSEMHHVETLSRLESSCRNQRSNPRRNADKSE